MTQEVILERGCYYDSARLMAVARALRSVTGVADAEVMMGTAMNRALLKDVGFAGAELDTAGPMDLIIAIRAESSEAVGEARNLLATLLSGREALSGGEAGPAATTRSGGPVALPHVLAAHPAASVVSIAVPGDYAAFVAHRALDSGRSVFLFSDNVSIAEEVALKSRAVEDGLLLMGPDCGTAILAGVGFGFANRVPRGPVGIVGASGTGTQELSCLLARAGIGISHAIGTGSRDLSREVDGRMTELGVRLLAADEMTQVIVVVAKHPHPDVAARLHRVFADLGKRVVARYLGEPGPGARDGVFYADSLSEAAAAAMLHVRCRPGPVTRRGPASPGPPSVAGLPSSRLALATPESGSESPAIAGRLVGLFGGGSLAAEAAHVLAGHGLSISAPQAALRPGEPPPGTDHLVIDTGDDVYTVGRPHPMVDPTVRCGLIGCAGADPGVGVLLLDLVLGDGAHPDPAPEIAAAVRRAREGRAHPLAVVCSVCGTLDDPQGLLRQEQTLHDAGIIVTATAAEAAEVAAGLLGAVGTSGRGQRGPA